MSSFDVSIIIVNWNTRDILRDCLVSVYEQTQGIEFEVIVIDNASTDGSSAMVKAEFPQVTLIENTNNRGFAAANNQGMAVALGRYLLFLNSDTIVLECAIQKTVLFADQHPEAAVIGCRVLNKDLTLQPTCFMVPSVFNLLLSMTYLNKVFPRSRFFGRERMTWWNREDVHEVQVVTGCYMLLRREAIDAVGRMDETYFMYAEEADWCFRFLQAGWKNLFTPGAQIIHLGGQSTQQIRPQMVLQLRAGILQFIKKHDGTWHYRLACLLTSLWFTIRIPYWLMRSFCWKSCRQQSLSAARIYSKGCIRAILGYKSLSTK